MPVLNRLHDGALFELQNLVISRERCEAIHRDRNAKLSFVVSDIPFEEPRA